MTFSSYLWAMRLSTLLSFIAWILALIYIDPVESGFIGKLLFFLTFFLFLTGFFMLIFTWIKKVFNGIEGAADNLSHTFRQGILFSFLLTTLLLLKGEELLTWWDGLLVLGALALIEFRFLARSQYSQY